MRHTDNSIISLERTDVTKPPIPLQSVPPTEQNKYYWELEKFEEGCNSASAHHVIRRKRQVILYLKNDPTLFQFALSLQNKWVLKGRSLDDHEIIPLTTENDIPKSKNIINGNTRLTIIGHGSSVSGNIIFTGITIISATRLAKIIKGMIDTVKVGFFEIPLSINLVVCFGAYRTCEGESSFAHYLHAALLNEDVHANITARESMVRVVGSGRKLTCSLGSTEEYVRFERQLNYFQQSVSMTDIVCRMPHFIEQAFLMRSAFKDSNAFEHHLEGSKHLVFSHKTMFGGFETKTQTLPKKSVTDINFKQKSLEILFCCFGEYCLKIKDQVKPDQAMFFYNIIARMQALENPSLENIKTVLHSQHNVAPAMSINLFSKMPFCGSLFDAKMQEAEKQIERAAQTFH